MSCVGIHICGGFFLILADLLSLFYTYKAGAKHVYAVEASEMAEYARKLIAGNPSLAHRITVRCYHVTYNFVPMSLFVSYLIQFMALYHLKYR